MLITVLPIFGMPNLVDYTGWYSSYHNYGYQVALVHLLPFIFIVQTSTIWVTMLVGINRYIAVCMPYQASEFVPSFHSTKNALSNGATISTGVAI